MNAPIGRASDALAKLLDVYTYYTPARVRQMLEGRVSRHHMARTAERLNAAIPQAAPLYVTSAIGALLQRAAETYPDAPLLRSSLPFGTGWIWFAEPVPLPHHEPMCALFWQCVLPVGPDGEIYPAFDHASDYISASPATAQGVLIDTFLASSRQHSMPLLRDFVVLPFGAPPLSWSGVLRRQAERAREGNRAWLTEEADNLEVVTRLFLTLVAFLNQRLLATNQVPTHHAGTRKKLTRAGIKETTVQVVELRRREIVPTAPAHDEDEPKRQYSVQWLVRGHWRRQYYPGSKIHKPRWIAPYVKGDPEKPLKETPVRIYAVRR